MRLEDIKGLGTKRILKLNEAGLNNPADLLMIFPSKYLFSQSRISNFEVGAEAAVIAKCVSEPRVSFVRKGLSFVKAVFSDGDADFDCIWFNQPYVKRQLVVDKTYAIVGKVKKSGNKTEIYVSMSSALTENEEIVTLYRAYKGVPAKVLKEAILQVLNNVAIEGQVSEKMCRENGILPLDRCIKSIHLPKNREDLNESKLSAALQILAYNIAAFLELKGSNAQNKTNKYTDSRAILQKVIKSLPYELTSDQMTAIEDIVNDLHGERKMNRLLEGDVGCGKTVVAFLAMYYAAMSGYQAALMAPTEILAQQHYLKALDFFGPLKINCELLCGSQSKDRRSEALFNLETGNAQIVIGTHSIFQDAVKFKNLALVIADEQQRFGVEQRGSFENKGENADSLVMSATPIPRTLALTLYGDLDISLIKSLPQSKARIFTRFVPKKKERDMFDYIYRKSLEGEKSYIVCPRIDDEDAVSATKVFDALRKKYPAVGMVHGQMKEVEKNEVMRLFAAGEIKILVSTTVIEVGIDVPDAINIVIFDAESYGLSQLHQLRGRVGRGTKDSYCFVISKEDKPDKRLEYFINCSSGFELAEYDFKIRGAGDFLGKRQHGTDNIFWDVSVNETLLSRAKELADKLISTGELRLTDDKSLDYIKGLTLN